MIGRFLIITVMFTSPYGKSPLLYIILAQPVFVLPPILFSARNWIRDYPAAHPYITDERTNVSPIAFRYGQPSSRDIQPSSYTHYTWVF